MAGSALAAVQAQQTLLTQYATEAISSASSALDTLAGIEVPYPSTVVPGYTPIDPFNPVSASPASPVSAEGAPDIIDIEIPDSPVAPDIPNITVTDISLGDMLDIVLPDVPVVTIEPLVLEAPTYDIPASLPWAFAVGDVLISDDPMIQACITRLKNNIVNGGTGLSADVEDAIWNRDLERMGQQLQDSTDKATTMWARKGFSLPDGLLAHSLSELQKEYMNKSIDRSREISIEQAKLEQNNLFKSIELAYNLASKLIDNLIQYENLVFKGQEATAKFANEYIDIQIKTYASLVEIYKAKAQTYDIIIKAEMAKIDLYKAQLEAQRLVGSVNEQTLKIYSETIGAVRLIIDKYRSEVDAFSAKLASERIKVESNKLQMDSWAESTRVKIAHYNGQVEQFRAQSGVNVSSAELYNKVAEANLRALIANNDVSVKAIEAYDKANLMGIQIRMEAAKGVAQATGNMAAGAMAAVHAQASMGYNENMSGTV